MTRKSRWMSSVLTEARKSDAKMPWARGVSRSARKLRRAQHESEEPLTIEKVPESL